LQNRGFGLYSKLRRELLKLRRWSLGLRRWMRGRTRQGEPGEGIADLRLQIFDFRDDFSLEQVVFSKIINRQSTI
jgi:hypothetical protein